MKNYRRILCVLCTMVLTGCALWMSPRKRAEESYKAGWIARENGSNETALVDFSEAINRDPKFISAYFNRASVEVSLTNFSGALADWTEVIELDPSNQSALAFRAASRLQLKDFTGAVSDCNSLLKLNPNDSTAVLVRGASKFYLNDYQAASNDLDTAVSMSSDNAMARHCRGLLRANERDWDDAKTDLTEVIRINPYDAQAYHDRAAIEILTRDYEKGMDDASNALRLDPGNIQDPYHFIAHARVELKDKAGALAEVNELVKLEPSNAVSYFARANIRALCDDLPGASNDMQTAVRMSPTNTSIYITREILEQKLRHPDAALADLNRILAAQEPHSIHLPEIYEAMGYALENLRQWEPALEDFRKGLAYNSPPDGARFETFLLQCLLGEKQQALKELDTYINSIPASKTNDWTAGIANYLAGNSNEKDFFAQATIRAKRPTDVSPHICDAYYFEGMEYLLAGDNAKARERFQKCVNTREDNSYNYMNAIVELDILNKP